MDMRVASEYEHKMDSAAQSIHIFVVHVYRHSYGADFEP